ncbi:hypothetical protein [Tautonia sociabilis]|uniref:Uncharacterized protein n=1 Tax=Tautonia sociabilis TaxID=2080755 RepID=A0A432MMQ1_9BACT|nr:hypothetical protein [Tautonia sociabilis]RUL88721.1 hypothetical protein TsocGM_06185 [Tautonia sociabilis]
MGRHTGITAAAGLAALLSLAASPEAKAQGGAIGLQPNVGAFNDGVFLNATPVVTADRRHVRLGGINANVSAIRDVQPFTFTAGAVSGGGIGGFGGAGGVGGLGAVGGAGLGGGAAVIPGLGAVGPVGGFYGYGYPYPYPYGGYYGGYYGAYPGGVYAGIPAGPLRTGPVYLPQQTVNGLGGLGGSIMNSVSPRSWRRVP